MTGAGVERGSISRTLGRLPHAPLRSYVRYAPTDAGKAHLAGGLIRRFRALPETRTVRTKSGVRLHVTTDDYLQAYIYLFGVWEPNLTHWIGRTLRPSDTFVDVGANIGYHAITAARILAGGDGQVVAIEASPEFADAMTANLALNRSANVRVVNLAASDHSAMLEFYQPHPHNRGHTTSVHACAGPALFTAGCKPLPDILTTDEVRRTRLVKIDVEGAELAVVRGLLPALHQMRPDLELVIEVSPDLLAVQGDNAAELFGLLAAHGFHAYRIDNDYCVSGYVPRRPPTPPIRCRSPVAELADFVFSRRDQDEL